MTVLAENHIQFQHHCCQKCVSRGKNHLGQQTIRTTVTHWLAMPTEQSRPRFFFAMVIYMVTVKITLR